MFKTINFIAVCCALAVSAASAQAQDFQVHSSSSRQGLLSPAQYFNGMGCTGASRSPQLSWSGAPAGTQSYVISMYDPDAPTGSGWWHWVLANVPAQVTQLAEGAGSAGGKLPAGTVEVRGDTGSTGYTGACPPAGETHRYIVTIRALNVAKLDLPPTATPAMLNFITLHATLGEARLTLIGTH